MAGDFAEAIKQLQNSRSISQELVLKTIEVFLLAAYKKTFGTDENAVVRFSEDNSDVGLFARKRIVTEDDYYDPVIEILLEEALELNAEGEPGDELEIEIDPHDFDRSAVQTAKQRAWQDLKEIQKDTLYSEFKDKEGEMIIGYFQREKNGNIFVDLGKMEGILPKRYQSPREDYQTGDRIKAYILEVAKKDSGLQVVLSRTHPEFVKKILEIEVPEVYDQAIIVEKIVREPGYRTKIAVRSTREDIDPVGACVGVKGIRIQSIVKELEGEKIDILKYDPDPTVFIKNALSPAEVLDVVILDQSKKNALAIVGEQQLSLAIGKQGLNVRLANRLADWNIDVKTEEQFREMGLSDDILQAVTHLFGDEGETQEGSSEEITNISELPNIPQRIVEILRENGIELIEALFNIEFESLKSLHGLTDDDIVTLKKIMDDNIEIVDENNNDFSDEENDYTATEENDEIESFECPECGASITIDSDKCPSCGVGLSFEFEETEEEEEEETDKEPVEAKTEETEIADEAAETKPDETE